MMMDSAMDIVKDSIGDNLQDLYDRACDDYEDFIINSAKEITVVGKEYKKKIASFKKAMDMGFDSLNDYEDYEYLRQNALEFEIIEKNRIEKLQKKKEQQIKLLQLLKPSYDEARKMLGYSEEPTFEEVLRYFSNGFVTYEQTMADIQCLFLKVDGLQQ